MNKHHMAAVLVDVHKHQMAAAIVNRRQVHT